MMESGEIVEYVEVEGARLWTAREESGPPVVLCHGGPGLWDYMRPVAEMLDDVATVYRYDQRACGRSSGEPPFDVAGAVADLDALREHWGHEQWVVAGHSWGATLALAYALRHPEHTRGLIYMSGTGVDPAWHDEYVANRYACLTPEHRVLLAQLERKVLEAHAAGDEEFARLDRQYCELAWSCDMLDREGALEQARTLFVDDLHVNYEVNRELSDDAHRFTESRHILFELARMQTPTLVIHGKADPRPAWAAQKLAELIPRAECVLLEGAAHFPWIDQAVAMREVLRRFMLELV